MVVYSEIAIIQLMKHREKSMFGWAIAFLIVALIAGAFGFFGLAGAAATAAKIVFVVGLILFVLSLIFGRKKTVVS